MRIILLVLSSWLFSIPVLADYLSPAVGLTRKFVVFPFKADPSLQGAADQAWWRAREQITDKKRFLVASKQYLLQKEVFQPRGELKSEDARLLGDLLDADALITGECVGRAFTLRVYEGKTGRMYFTKKLNFHPSLRASEQFVVVTERLTQDFMAAIPYQAFITTDPLVGKPLYNRDDKTLALVDAGSTENLVPEMDIQVISIKESAPNKPLFQGGAEVEVLAEGKVVSVEGIRVEVEISRAKDLSLIKDKALIRIPREAVRISQAYGLTEERVTIVQAPLPDLINPSGSNAADAKQSATWFGSFVGMLAVILFAL